jgi:hypothetical protein
VYRVVSQPDRCFNQTALGSTPSHRCNDVVWRVWGWNHVSNIAKYLSNTIKTHATCYAAMTLTTTEQQQSCSMLACCTLSTNWIEPIHDAPVKYLNATTNICLIRIGRDYIKALRAVINSITCLAAQSCRLEILHVGGMATVSTVVASDGTDTDALSFDA